MDHTKPRAYKSLNSSEIVTDKPEKDDITTETYSVTLLNYNTEKFIDVWRWLKDKNGVEILNDSIYKIIVNMTASVKNELVEKFNCLVNKTDGIVVRRMVY